MLRTPVRCIDDVVTNGPETTMDEFPLRRTSHMHALSPGRHNGATHKVVATCDKSGVPSDANTCHQVALARSYASRQAVHRTWAAWPRPKFVPAAREGGGHAATRTRSVHRILIFLYRSRQRSQFSACQRGCLPVGLTVLASLFCLPASCVPVHRTSGHALAPVEFATTRPRPTAVQFDDAVAANIELKIARTGQPLVRPFINGRDVGWFILDTGAAAMAVTGKTARSTKMIPGDSVRAVGVGGSVDKGTWKGTSFRLGPVVMEQPRFVEMNIPFSALVFGAGISGVIGYDFFAAAVIDLDFRNRHLSVYRSGDETLPNFDWTHLDLYKHLPVVRCRFEGDREGLFMIDTGFNGSVAFFPHAVEQLGLLENRKLRRALTLGAGGGGITQRGRIAWFELGEQRNADILVVFETTARSSLLEDSTLTGMIGVGLLKRYRVVLDYANNRAAFL